MSCKRQSLPQYSIGSQIADKDGIRCNDRELVLPIKCAECETELSKTMSPSQYSCQQSTICSSLERTEVETRSIERPTLILNDTCFYGVKSNMSKFGEDEFENSSTSDFFLNSEPTSVMKSSDDVSEQSFTFPDSPTIHERSNLEESSTSSEISSITLEEDKNAITPNTMSHIPKLFGPMLRWEPKELIRVRSWITCICLVDFDLSLGQTLKFGYPSGQLTASEGQNVASLAFPDSHSSDLGCYNFCFRFRASARPSGTHMQYPYLFGYVFFCQKPDSTIKRGYFQKSVVLVSHLPFTKLFLRVVEVIGPLFFRYGSSILEATCRDISRWPCPTNFGKFTVPILGELVNVNLRPHGTPPYSRPVRAKKSYRISQLSYPEDISLTIKQTYRQNFTQMLSMGFCAEVAMRSLEQCGNNIKKAIATLRAKSKEAAAVGKYQDGMDLTELWNPASFMKKPSGIFQDVNIYEVFQNVLGSLWSLWECAIAGQATMVFSQSPEKCTKAVLGIMSIISPVTYAGDFRPYFTIYDPDFKHFQKCDERDTLGCLILGVTNPFFLQAYKNWGNVLYLTAPCGNNGNGETNSKKARRLLSPMEVQQYSYNNLRKPIVKRLQDKLEYTDIDIMVVRNSALEPDQRILRTLIKPSKSKRGRKQVSAEAQDQISAINTVLLRKYFRNMTNCFLRPFHIYLTWDKTSLNRENFNPYLNGVTLFPFRENEFLEEIRRAPKDYFKNIPFKGGRASVVKLYAKFLRSPHFQPWFYRKRKLAQARLTKALNRQVMHVQFKKLMKVSTRRSWIAMYGAIKLRIKLNQDNVELKTIMVQHLNMVKRAIRARNLEKDNLSQSGKASSKEKLKQS